MLNYKLYGMNNKDTIILIHGLAQTHKAFDEQLEFADNYQLVIPDLRGHGDSVLDEQITLEQMAIDVIELVDHLHIKEATLMGVSLGTLVLQEIYNIDPTRVKALILSNGYSYVPQVFLEMEIENRKHKLSYMTDDEYITDVAKKCTLSMDSDVISKVKNTFKLNRDIYISCASAPLGKNYTNVAKSISVKTLICSGQWDFATPYILQFEQKRMIKGSKHVQFWSGHLPNIECVGEFNQVVRDFMKEVK